VESAAGLSIPADRQVLDRWSDGSIRWVLIDCQVDAGSDYRLVVCPDSVRSDGLRIETRDSSIVVHTGVLSFEVRPGGSELVRQLAPASKRLRMAAIDPPGSAIEMHFDRAAVETPGAQRCTVRLDGRMHGAGYEAVAACVRLDFFAHSAALRVSVSLRNTRRARHPQGIWELGDPGSLLLRDVSLVLVGTDSNAAITCWPDLESAPLSAAGSLSLYQDSSGGESWRSPVHVNRQGRIPVRFRGYRIETASGATAGLRAEPVVSARNSAGDSMAACVQQFWQNFPKAIEVDGSRIVMHLFPRQFDDLHELQGGEQKTHVMGIAFGDDPISDVPLDWVRTPLVVSTTPEWYAEAQAMPYLTPTSVDPNAAYLKLASAAIMGDDTFEHKRERIDEYGWRNFGDIYADHEAVGHEGPTPLVSHYNNQYDAIAGFGIQFMRSGDVRWWQAMLELAAHVIDIDLYHTTEDRAAYSGGYFWHTFHYKDAGRSTHRAYPRAEGVDGGGPSNEQDYSTGMMLHYYLTGSVPSREAVLDLAEWVLNLDDGRLTVFKWLSRGATGLASATVSPLYHGPGRGAANSIITLLNAYRLTAQSRFLHKAEELIRRCIHPEDEPERLDLLDAERRWSYTVFLQALGRYLDDKAQLGEIDAAYAYAQASLVRYAEWMAAHEYPYLDRPEILEYPNETWSAQDMRKSDVFKLAARHARSDRRDRFLERSRFFFRSSIEALGRSPTRTLARPVVLMLSYGYFDAAFALGIEPAPAAPSSVTYGLRARFEPQRQIAMRRAKRLIIASAGIGLVVAVLLITYFGSLL
jgi:hypothetical protein